MIAYGGENMTNKLGHTLLGFAEGADVDAKSGEVSRELWILSRLVTDVAKDVFGMINNMKRIGDRYNVPASPSGVIVPNLTLTG